MNVYMLLFLPFMFLLRMLITTTLNNRNVGAVGWFQNKWHHEIKPITRGMVETLTYTPTEYYHDFNDTLDKILIPRVPGTEGHNKVKEYISSSMKELDWDVEEDSFRQNTPHGNKPFTNIVATLDRTACRRLVLACHYDSKVNREYTFVGATDSAVPCAMLIHLARVLDEQLKEQRNREKNLTLQLVFFDGEEAFEQWSATDSLYGSRHLASKWDQMLYSREDEETHCKKSKDYASMLDRIDVLLLLDLLGGASPRFYSYFPDTENLFGRFVTIEQRLNSMKQLESDPPQSVTSYFKTSRSFAFVEDDHVPFLKRGVPILHIIPNPFPAVWHRETDDREHLHHPTINNFNKMLRVFVAEYLHLTIPDILSAKHVT